MVSFDLRSFQEAENHVMCGEVHGTANPLHSHSSDLTNVIISGTWYTGADEASAKDFGPGSVVFMPGEIHVSGCRAGSNCVFYQDGKGKFDFRPAAAKPGT